MNLHEKIAWEYPDESMRSQIQRMLDEYPPTEASWDKARALLSGREFRFEGNLHLDDTGDVAYHARFTHDELAQVVSGIIYQAGLGKRVVIRNFELAGDMVGMVMSQGSANNLRQLVPSLNLTGFSMSAGHIR